MPPAFERFIVFSSYAACTRMRNSIAQRPSTSATKRRWARMASCIVHMSGRQLTGPTCGRLGPSGRLAVFARHAAALGKDAAQRDAREPAALPRPRTARTYAGHMHARFTPRAHTRCEQPKLPASKQNHPDLWRKVLQPESKSLRHAMHWEGAPQSLPGYIRQPATPTPEAASTR